MKKFAIAVVILIFSAFLLQAETIANVSGHKGLLLTIDKGSLDGVATGMKGIVKAVYKDPGGEYTINIGIFTVRRAGERSAEVAVEIGKGLNPEDASFVVFEQVLVAAEKKPEAPTPKTQGKGADGYVDQGDKAAEASDFKAALAHYQKALELEPGNLVAQEKCNEMKQAIAGADRGAKFKEYLKKADAYYEKGNIKFAILYLFEALRLYPEGKKEVKERLAVMDREYPQELAALLNDKSAELKDIRPQIDALLAPKAESEPRPGPEAAKKNGETFSEPFLKRVAARSEGVARNEKGFWEAAFADGIRMVYIAAGEFTLGSPAGQGDDDEHPSHRVALSGYWIGKNEVTFEQYDRFCAESGRSKAEDEGWGRGTRPAIYVSWDDAAAFCAWLKKKTGLPFRLPSEAEWEKAARDRFPWGTMPPNPELANFNKEHMMTRPVGSFPKGASPYGVLDLAGNVWEWTRDWYDPGFYQDSARENPQGPESGAERVVRGGCWANGAGLVRAANRSSEKPDSKLNILGFRLALDGE